MSKRQKKKQILFMTDFVNTAKTRVTVGPVLEDAEGDTDDPFGAFEASGTTEEDLPSQINADPT